ncbi:Quinol monooxygenase YgiN [Sporobacter termitidis DSM 10068]|uniref:Quinol monooxygenase YgiN n=1 Tax=Sporobacter termitidis DSM 10068 TaxID=1123282 RepID=A0A1M5YDI4_9FIRM|nr:putative quinol monooxygenase [Sporobacter termitidis]SHI09563.1 Quinol monooxygenase YgiN [Sporobacter termitidis DSM 10068]
MIIDLIKFTAKTDCIDSAIRAMKTQTAQNRRDEGCLMSHVFQSGRNPAELYMLLGWENREALEKHLAAPHDAEFRADMDDKIAGPPEFFDWTQLV